MKAGYSKSNLCSNNIEFGLTTNVNFVGLKSRQSKIRFGQNSINEPIAKRYQSRMIIETHL